MCYVISMNCNTAVIEKLIRIILKHRLICLIAYLFISLPRSAWPTDLFYKRFSYYTCYFRNVFSWGRYQFNILGLQTFRGYTIYHNAWRRYLRLHSRSLYSCHFIRLNKKLFKINDAPSSSSGTPWDQCIHPCLYLRHVRSHQCLFHLHLMDIWILEWHSTLRGIYYHCDHDQINQTKHPLLNHRD